jgi:hypothetical protein
MQANTNKLSMKIACNSKFPNNSLNVFFKIPKALSKNICIGCVFSSKTTQEFCVNLPFKTLGMTQKIRFPIRYEGKGASNVPLATSNKPLYYMHLYKAHFFNTQESLVSPCRRTYKSMNYLLQSTIDWATMLEHFCLK